MSLFQKKPPEFHPQAVIRDWGNGHAFRIADAQTGVCVFGATGSGKTSGPAKHLAYGYLAEGFSGLVLCAKVEERRQWEKWAADCGRTDDLVIVDSSGKWRFNVLDWEASRPDAGGGLVLNIVALLDELAGTIANSGSKGGGIEDASFWKDSLHHLNTNLVELPLLAGLQVSLPLMRSILNSAPLSLSEAQDPKWQESSICAATIREADKATAKADPDIRADFEEVKHYFLHEWPALSDRTRSVISMSFSTLVKPLITRPLRKLFCSDTNIKPEDAFSEGKIIIIDLPIQSYRQVGRIANLIWKYCFQISVLRRSQPASGFLRPVFIWADEAQNFISQFDSEYQAVARSAGGCTVYLTQNVESFRRVLGNYDAVYSLLGNLQAKFYCQNAGDTNDWASKLLGNRWLKINTTSVGQDVGNSQQQQQNGHNSGVSRAEQQRAFVEPATFTTLKRGGALNNFQVEAIVYLGGHQFTNGSESLPYKLLTFNQK